VEKGNEFECASFAVVSLRPTLFAFSGYSLGILGRLGPLNKRSQQASYL